MCRHPSSAVTARTHGTRGFAEVSELGKMVRGEPISAAVSGEAGFVRGAGVWPHPEWQISSAGKTARRKAAFIIVEEAIKPDPYERVFILPRSSGGRVETRALRRGPRPGRDRGGHWGPGEAWVSWKDLLRGERRRHHIFSKLRNGDLRGPAHVRAAEIL